MAERLFPGCLRPARSVLLPGSGFWQLKRETEQEKKRRFYFRIEKSALKDIQESVEGDMELAEIWRPWDFIPRNDKFLSNVASRENLLDELEKLGPREFLKPSLPPLPPCPEAEASRRRCEELLQPRDILAVEDSALQFQPLEMLEQADLFPPQAAVLRVLQPQDWRLVQRLSCPGRLLDRVAAVTRRPRQEEPVSPACREVNVDWQERERQFQERIHGLQQVTMATVGDLVPFINLELESLASEQAKKDLIMIEEVVMELVEESMGLGKEDKDQGMEDDEKPSNTVVAENVDADFKKNHSNTFPDINVDEKLEIKPEEVVLLDQLKDNKEKELESDISVEIRHDMSSEMKDEEEIHNELKIKDTEKFEEIDNKLKNSAPVKEVKQHMMKKLEIIVLLEKGERDMENEPGNTALEEKLEVNTDTMEKVKDIKDLPSNTGSVEKVAEGIERTTSEEKVVMEEKLEEKMYKDLVNTDTMEKVNDIKDLPSNTISLEKVEEGIERTTIEENEVMDISFNNVTVQMDKQAETINPEIDIGNLDKITESNQVMVKLSIVLKDLERSNKVTDMVSEVVLDIVKQALECSETVQTEIYGEAEEEYTTSSKSNMLTQLHKAEKENVSKSISIESICSVVESGYLRKQQKTEISEVNIYAEVQPQEDRKVFLERKIEADQSSVPVMEEIKTFQKSTEKRKLNEYSAVNASIEDQHEPTRKCMRFSNNLVKPTIEILAHKNIVGEGYMLPFKGNLSEFIKDIELELLYKPRNGPKILKAMNSRKSSRPRREGRRGIYSRSRESLVSRVGCQGQLVSGRKVSDGGELVWKEGCVVRTATRGGCEVENVMKHAPETGGGVLQSGEISNTGRSWEKLSVTQSRKKPQVRSFLLLSWLCQDQEFLMQLEAREGLLVHVREEDQLPAGPDVMLGPRAGAYILGLGEDRYSSPEECLASSMSSLDHVWLVSVGSPQLHLRSCQLVQWAALEGDFRLSALLCPSPSLLSHTLGALAKEQVKGHLTDVLTEQLTTHELLLLRLFPFHLTSFAAQVILNETSLLHLLSLSMQEMVELLPWLSLPAAREICMVSQAQHRLHDFVEGREEEDGLLEVKEEEGMQLMQEERKGWRQDFL